MLTSHHKPIEKRVYILRGLPGMGKTTIAELLRDHHHNSTAVICSADQYHMVKNKETGEKEYKYNPKRIGLCHQLCQRKFHRSVEAKIPVIVLDNTNLIYDDYRLYEQVALKAGYKVFEITVGSLDVQTSFERNSHDVPMDTIQKMAKRFEFVVGDDDDPSPLEVTKA